MLSYTLRPEEIERARKNPNGLTFSPRGCNKLVCNQALRMGRITKKVAESLKKQVWPRTSQVIASKSAKVIRPTRLLQAVYNFRIGGESFWSCPYCQHKIGRFSTYSEEVCPYCNQIFVF